MATTIKSSSLDFASIKNNLKSFLQQKEEFKDYNFEALRLDTNKEFTKFQTGSLIGTITVSEATDSLEQK